jgi:transcription initiation factor TFIIB
VELNKGPEWRSFDTRDYEAKARATTPIDSLIPTSIGGLGKDSRGNKLPLSKIHLMYRLRKLQNRARIHENKSRNLAQALSEVDRLVSRLHLSTHVKEEATRIYREALDKDLVKGRSIEAIVGASVYAACRLTGTPRTLDEVALNCSVDARDLARGYRLVHDKLMLDTPNPDPRTRIPRIAERVGASEMARLKAVMILTAAMEARATSGKNPVGLAAAALYVACQACGDRVTQKAISEASGVTEVTIRNRCKKLERYAQ